jgi:hypothetical protein
MLISNSFDLLFIWSALDFDGITRTDKCRQNKENCKLYNFILYFEDSLGIISDPWKLLLWSS